MCEPETLNPEFQPGSCAITPYGCCSIKPRYPSEVVTTSRVQTMFSFQVVPFTISRSSLLLAIAGTFAVAYLTPSLPLPLAQAQVACPEVTEYVPVPPAEVTALLVMAARLSLT